MDEQAIARFWKFVEVAGDDECWLWRGARTPPRGYGNFGAGGAGSTVSSHRYSWMIANGPIPEGMHVCHRCDNPPCVNPQHLFLGTRSDNINDMYKKGRYPVRRGEKASRSKLTAEQVIRIRAQRAAGASLSALASEYSVAMQSIHSIVTRRCWRHV